jgi:hypothetical protein
MEGSTAQPEYDGQPKPDFYELILGDALLNTLIHDDYNTFLVEDIDITIDKLTRNYPATSIVLPKTKVEELNEYLAVVEDPSTKTIVLRQVIKNRSQIR